MSMDKVFWDGCLDSFLSNKFCPYTSEMAQMWPLASAASRGSRWNGVFFVKWTRAHRQVAQGNRQDCREGKGRRKGVEMARYRR